MDTHITVLPRESVEALSIRKGSVIVDATANGGGHSKAIVDTQSHHGGGVLVSIDIDPKACTSLETRFAPEIDQGRVKVVRGNFRDIDMHLSSLSIEKVDGILADLGWSTNQFEAVGDMPPRGFSFMKDEPLVMTYGNPREYSFTATDIVNRWNEEDIANVLYGYADERHSRRIASAIVAARKNHAITTSGELSSVILEAMPRRGKLHPATKTFQALRIAVNDELAALETFIASGFERLASGGRFAIISFHSIEDRIVKLRFKQLVAEGKAHNPIKKHISPTDEEIEQNPRARSAKLRIIERI